MYVEILTNNIEDEGRLYQSLIDMNDSAVAAQLGIDFMPNRGAAVFFIHEDQQYGDNMRSVLLGFGTRALKTAKIKGSTEIILGNILSQYDKLTTMWIMDDYSSKKKEA